MAGQDPIMYDYQALQTAFQTVKQFGEQVNKLGGALTKVHDSLAEHCSGDESGVGAVIAGAAKDVTGVAGKVFSEGGRVLAEMGSRGKTNGERMQHTDDTVAKAFNDIHDNAYGDRPGAGAGNEPNGSRSSTEPGGGKTEPPSLSNGTEPGSGGQTEDGNGECTTDGDPVDVVSGQMITAIEDLSLPGLLPIVLRRAYASGYRAGLRYGPGWASTLDQRIEIDDDGIHYAGDDAQILHYPVPRSGEQVLPAGGARWPLIWDRAGNMIRICDPHTGLTRHFPAPARPDATGNGVRRNTSREIRPLAALTDRNGHRIDFLYDHDGIPVEVRHTGGYRIAVDSVYTAAGFRIEALRLLDGPDHAQGITVLRYEFDPRGRLVGVVNSSGLPFVYEYDAADRITAWIDRNGYRYEYEYDEAGRVCRGVGPDGFLSSTFEYDLENRVTRSTDGLGSTTEYHYDEHHHICRTVNPNGGVFALEIDQFGQQRSVQDESGHVTRWTIDERDDVVRIDWPDGHTTAFEYNDLHQVVRIVRPDGLTESAAYDERGNPLSVTDAAGAVTSFEYDPKGHLTAITDALGQTTRFICDALGLPIEITSPVGAVTRARRDAFGRVVELTDPLGGVTSSRWSVEGRIVERTTAQGATERSRYDAEGNLVERTDPAGRTTRFEYGPFDRLTARIRDDRAQFAFAYDSALRLTSVTNPAGLTWTYEYDAAGFLVAERDFDHRSVTYRHDPAGYLSELINGAGEAVSFERDAMGRVITQRAGDHTTTYSYDALGRLVRVTDPVADIVLERDPAGRVTSESCNGSTISYRYDAAGRRLERTTPAGVTSSWQYDGVGQPVAMHGSAQVTTHFWYDPRGREQTRMIGDAVRLDQIWSADDQLLSQTLTAAQPTARVIQQRRYAYRADGIVTGIDDLISGERTFDVDPRGMIVAVHGADRIERYSYDADGELTGGSWPDPAGEPIETTVAKTRGAMRTRTVGRTRYEYDSQGRVTAKIRKTLSGQVNAWRYRWGRLDRLERVELPDGHSWHYWYDPLGRRIAKQHLAPDGETVLHTTTFTWDGVRLAEQVSHASEADVRALTWDYEPDSYRPLAQTETRWSMDPQHAGQIDRAFYAIVSDLVGAPVELVAPDGTVAWRHDSTVWGSPVPPRISAVADCPIRFPGQYADAETGLHYNVMRYYDPEAAGYLSADPLGLAGSSGPHRYPDNPMIGIDPLGLIDCKRGKKLAQSAIDRATKGVRNEAKEIPGKNPGDPPIRQGYHGRLSPSRELEVMSNPDAVYMSSAKDQMFTFRKDGDVVVTLGGGDPSGANNIFTSYGPSGPQGKSGAAIFGGAETDPGPPITHDQIVNGRIPRPGGGFLDPAQQIWP